MLATIQIDQIDVGRRLRDISEAQVASLMDSIGDVGLLNPITVYSRPVIRGGVSVEGYGLVAGAHRLEACTRLGLVEIEATVVELSELERQIAECDENLCAASLTPSEKAMFTRRRKEAYEALHPETKHGGDRASRQLGDLKETDRFTADTAVRTGTSERVVQRNAERGTRISEQALQLVRGSKLDTGTYLDKLKAIPAEKQAAQVKSDLTPRKPVPPPSEPHNPMEAYNKWAADMNRVWSRAPQEWRDRWLSHADATVFDHGFAS